MAKHIRALKSIVDDNDESYAVQKAFAQLTEEFFRENTLLLIVCLLKLTLEVQRDATQVVANLRRQKVQLRLIASEYLQKNTGVLDLLVAGCGNRHG
jgi:calcium binding protein 39